MKYTPESENVMMMPPPYTSLPRVSSPADDPPVQHIRKILMIIIGVCLVLSVPVLVYGIFEKEIETQNGAVQGRMMIGQGLFQILYFAFALYAVHRYSKIGLRVFGWVNVINIVGVIIIIVLVVFKTIIGAPVPTYINYRLGRVLGLDGTAAFIFEIVVYIANCILSVIFVKLAFKLARLIEANKRVITQQI